MNMLVLPALVPERVLARLACVCASALVQKPTHHALPLQSKDSDESYSFSL